MGSQVCCQQTPNYNFQESHKSSFSSIPSQPLKLSESVQQFLKKQRPYEKQLQNANLKYKLINGMLYHGETDFLGKPNGFGKLHHSDGSLFIGKFNNGMANGQGYYVEKNGAFYEGFISNNKADDPKGKYWNPNFSYIGGFQNNVFEGQGHILADDYQFKGVFKNGKKLSGIFKWTKHTPRLQRFAYKGTFDENQLFSGKGTLQTPVGKYQGSFVKNDKHGEGRFTFKNKLVYVGEYHKGVRSGGGILYNADETIAYNGQWRDGLPDGFGQSTKQNGQIVQGRFIEGIFSQIIQQKGHQQEQRYFKKKKQLRQQLSQQ